MGANRKKSRKDRDFGDLGHIYFFNAEYKHKISFFKKMCKTIFQNNNIKSNIKQLKILNIQK